MLKVGIMKLIEREDYENRLAAVMRTPDIKVLCGVRRAGKSKLLPKCFWQEHDMTNTIEMAYG